MCSQVYDHRLLSRFSFGGSGSRVFDLAVASAAVGAIASQGSASSTGGAWLSGTGVSARLAGTGTAVDDCALRAGFAGGTDGGRDCPTVVGASWLGGEAGRHPAALAACDWDGWG